MGVWTRSRGDVEIVRCLLRLFMARCLPGAFGPESDDYAKPRAPQGGARLSGRRHSAAGASPAVVAETILRAVTDRGWRLRYPVAPPAPLLVRLRGILPEAWFLRLIRRHYGIDG